MSRVGKKPIPVPSGVKVQIGEQLKVQGPKGTLEVPVPRGYAFSRTTESWS
jgi:large subunit ribosomal protein L6